jgi:menaquinone-dependent protoporphyrinogen oxidase
MAADVLIVYASRHGSTEQVGRRIAERLRGAGYTTRVEPAREVKDLQGCSSVLVGGSIYMGRWHHDAIAFLRRHHEELRRLPFAVYALGPGEDTEEAFAESRHQLDRALARFSDLEPRAVAVFGGVVNPQVLHFLFSRMKQRDLRDWDAIRSWALELPVDLELLPREELATAVR